MSVPDAELLRRVVRDRDDGAFSDLYDRHSPLVYGISLRMLGDDADAQDAAQAVFLYLWENADRFDPDKGELGAWLTVISRSRCLDRLRRRAYRAGHEQVIQVRGEDGDDRDVDFPDAAPTVLETLGATERDRVVRAAVKKLPAPQREALEAAYFGGLTQVEIAEKLGEPLGTVKTRMRLGLMKLAEFLKSYAEGGV